jgi:VIT1/CCC1 family predicted Fe2+/Mn2+ transporter
MITTRLAVPLTTFPREAELVRKTDQVIDNAPFQRAETYDILLSYGIHHRDADWAVNKLTEHANSHKWARFMMHFNLGIPEPDADPRRAAVSAALLAGGYFAGGLMPVVPYCFFVGGGGAAVMALAVSVGFTVVVLAVAGFGKTWVALQDRKAAYWGAGQAVVVGAVAAGVSYGVVCLLDLVIGFITGRG